MSKVLVRELGKDKDLWSSIPFFVSSESLHTVTLDNGAQDPQLRVRITMERVSDSFLLHKGKMFQVERLNSVPVGALSNVGEVESGMERDRR